MSPILKRLESVGQKWLMSVGRLGIMVLLATLITTLLATDIGRARLQTTVPQTILDSDRDNRLEPAPGEDHAVRDDLGQAGPDRERRRQEIIFFGQMTDLHILDEESPLRVEFLDKLGDPFTSAYRPQEVISPVQKARPLSSGTRPRKSR